VNFKKAEIKTGGRLKGSRNILSTALIETLSKEWREYGDEAVRIMRVENPANFVKTVAAIVPREFIGELPPIAIQTIQRTIVDPKVSMRRRTETGWLGSPKNEQLKN